jgi:hypothetical protein
MSDTPQLPDPEIVDQSSALELLPALLSEIGELPLEVALTPVLILD